MFTPFKNLRQALEENQKAAESARRAPDHKTLPPTIKRFVPQTLHK